MLWLIALAISTLVLILGIRGRRVAAPPHCRRCRFDLSGLVSPATCPECGRSLAHPHAVRHDRRARSRPFLAAASLATLLMVAGAGRWTARRATNLPAKLPTGVLLLVARRTEGASATVCIDELAVRRVAGKLTSEQVGTFHDDLLARLVNPKATWPPSAKAELWDAAQTRALLPAQYERYWHEAASATRLRARAVVRAGQLIAASFPNDHPRIGRDPLAISNESVLQIEFGLHQLCTVPASTAQSTMQSQCTGPRGGGEGVAGSSMMLAALPSAPSPGPYLGTARLWFSPARSRDRSGPPTDAFWITVESPIEVVAADEPTVTIHPDPGLESDLAAQIWTSDVKIRLESAGGNVRPEIRVSLPIRRLGLAFAATLDLVSTTGERMSFDLRSMTSPGLLDTNGSPYSATTAFLEPLSPSLYDWRPAPESARLRRLLGLPERGPIPLGWEASGVAASLTLNTSILAAESYVDVQNIWSGQVWIEGLKVVDERAHAGYPFSPPADAPRPTRVTAGLPIPDAPYRLADPPPPPPPQSAP